MLWGWLAALALAAGSAAGVACGIKEAAIGPPLARTPAATIELVAGVDFLENRLKKDIVGIFQFAGQIVWVADATPSNAIVYWLRRGAQLRLERFTARLSCRSWLGVMVHTF